MTLKYSLPSQARVGPRSSENRPARLCAVDVPDLTYIQQNIRDDAMILEVVRRERI